MRRYFDLHFGRSYLLEQNHTIFTALGMKRGVASLCCSGVIIVYSLTFIPKCQEYLKSAPSTKSPSKL